MGKLKEMLVRMFLVWVLATLGAMAHDMESTFVNYILLFALVSVWSYLHDKAYVYRGDATALFKAIAQHPDATVTIKKVGDDTNNVNSNLS